MKTLAALTMLICLVIMTEPTNADIVSTGGAVIEVSPPASVKAWKTEGDTHIIVFAEQQDFELTSGLDVDIVCASTYTGPDATLTAGTITAGIHVNRYMIHFDPVTGKTCLSGSVTFEEPILGLIVLNDTVGEAEYKTLNNLDYLGASGTDYPKRFERRTELCAVNAAKPDDQVTLSIDRCTVSVTLLASVRWQDQVRIITAKDPKQVAQVTLEEVKRVITELPPEVFKNKNSVKALINKIEATMAMIADGRYVEAIDKLKNDILKKTDGCAENGEPDKNDWILTCEAQAEIYPLVIRAIELLQWLAG